jgi:hypothetical protein
MADLRAWVAGAAGLVAVLATGGDARAQLFRREPPPAKGAVRTLGKLPVGTDELPADVQESVRKVLQSPTLTASGPADEFEGRPRTYDWLLSHPDRTAAAWARLNVPCAPITEVEPGHYSFCDESGTNVRWRLVWAGLAGRVWYAEGHVKPSSVLPLVPVQAVAVLRHDLPTDPDSVGPIRQQVDLFMHTDSRAAAAIMKVAGPTAPRMAEQGAQQLGMFFSVMSRYLDRHPEDAGRLLTPDGGR